MSSRRCLSFTSSRLITQLIKKATGEKSPTHTSRRALSHSQFARALASARRPGQGLLPLENLKPSVNMLEHVVRGPLIVRAAEIEKELEQGAKKPFNEVIKANIGDGHAMGQTPITFIRQVLALVSYPELIKDSKFPDDVKERAKFLLGACSGGSTGSYSDASGIEIIRRHVAEYIEKRDGFPSNWQDVVLCGGTSNGVKAVLKLLACEICGLKPAVMVPVPQYPLYSATLAEFDMQQVDYYLDESKGWALTTEELKRALNETKGICKPRALVVINPGNPTGQVLTKQNIQDIIKFAFEEGLILLADEVYQHNIYDKNSEFHSFKKVLMEMGRPYSEMELASFMSCSKGYMGECGIRGGYAEVINLQSDVKAMYLKCNSASLCSTILGQIAMDCVVKPPEPGQSSYELFVKEKTAVLKSLAKRAEVVANTFNSIEGISCSAVQGAMYAFPQIYLPPKAIEIAKQKGMCPDEYYAFELLENKGICIVPGSWFGQKEDTFHFRTTILPQTEKLKSMLQNLRNFHEDFLKKHQ